MTSARTPEPGTNYRLDARGYLDQYDGSTLTKAEHDALVEKRGRPVTDTGRTYRHHRPGSTSEV